MSTKRYTDEFKIEAVLPRCHRAFLGLADLHAHGQVLARVAFHHQRAAGITLSAKIQRVVSSTPEWTHDKAALVVDGRRNHQVFGHVGSGRGRIRKGSHQGQGKRKAPTWAHFTNSR